MIENIIRKALHLLGNPQYKNYPKVERPEINVSEEVMKETITGFCRDNKEHVYNQFHNPSGHRFYEEEYDGPEARAKFPYEETLKPENWVASFPVLTADGGSYITFDCTPFEDQLRAYVFLKDDKITMLEIRGE